MLVDRMFLWEQLDMKLFEGVGNDVNGEQRVIRKALDSRPHGQLIFICINQILTSNTPFLSSNFI
jgi:hypothetical protein